MAGAFEDGPRDALDWRPLDAPATGQKIGF